MGFEEVVCHVQNQLSIKHATMIQLLEHRFLVG
jgi:hypothetical protein